MVAAVRWFAILVWLGAAPAFAYRPFDQTDADVAPVNEFELEFGPVGVTASKHFSGLTPSFVLNYGIAPRLELVFDGLSQIGFGSARVGNSSWDFDSALLLKAVLLKGALQGESGISIATEGGVLMPLLPSPGSLGSTLAVIISDRWSFGTLHVNVLGERSRAAQYSLMAGAIAEGPDEWTLRPVAEGYVEQQLNGGTSFSILGGAIWRISESLSLDAALRTVPSSAPLFELRLGLTWSVSG